MGIFGFLERSAGDSKVTTDATKLTQTGYSGYDAGNLLTSEGLGDLRSLQSTYSGRLSDPLGAVGRGIFSRARAGLQDNYARDVNAGAASTAQLARQSGGVLTPEQVAAQNAANQRDASQSLFQGTGNVANAEATATLSEQGKLFDRLDSIANTITSVGQNERTQGLNSIIQSLTNRTNIMQNKVKDVLAGFGR